MVIQIEFIENKPHQKYSENRSNDNTSCDEGNN